jgi:hypothetical protein
MRSTLFDNDVPYLRDVARCHPRLWRYRRRSYPAQIARNDLACRASVLALARRLVSETCLCISSMCRMANMPKPCMRKLRRLECEEASRPNSAGSGQCPLVGREPTGRFWRLISGRECPCVDAPLDSRGALRDLYTQVQVLPCVRPVDAAIITAAGLYGDRGSGPDRDCALEAPGHFTGFPDPVF